jgi:subtilisin family serine protease
MQNALAGLADLSTTKVSKVFTRLTTVDSTVITHDGDTIELPPFWATLCLHFQDSINADTIIYTSDSLLKSLFDYQERNRVMADINFSPNDFYFNNGNQEHLENKTSSNIGINMEKAWNIERGRTSIRTGVYDTGVAWDHEDFELSTQGGLNSYKINGGFDYIDNLTIDKSTTDHSVAPGSNPSSPNLAIGHGTICAGIIGARTNNFKNSQYLGVAGIAGGNNTQSYGTTLYSYRVIGQSLIGVAGASSTQIADAILDSYVDGGSKLHLTNNSWGASYFNDKDYIDNGYETLRRQFWKGTEAGVLFVMASGNDNDDRPTYPSCLFDPGMIRVGAYSNNLERASFSNYGPFLDLVAPGTEEQYTVLTQSGGYYNSTSDDYLINGTSFAAPHVTGVAALMISEWEESGEDSNNEGAETLYPEDIEWILKQSANDIDYDNQVTEEEADEGYDEFTGWGQLDAYKALQMVERPNFTIVHLAKTISFNINNATPVLDDKKICMEGNFDNLINGKNHKVTVYEVSTTIKQELPAGYKIVNQNTPQLGSISISENGYWPLNNKSGLFGYDAANEKFWGHSGLEFVSAPQVITENGTKYIEGTIKGYFCYVRKRSGSITDNIEQWYPFNPNNKDVTLAFSVYLIDETLSVPALGENNSGLVIFPNPAEDFVTIRSYYNDLPNMILYSIDGKVQDINFEKVSGSDFKIDLSGLSTGVYILKSQSEGHCSFNRIIKN